MKKYILYVLFPIAIASCGTKSETENNSESAPTATVFTLSDEQMKKNGIETGHLQKKEMSGFINCTGSVEVPPQNVASIHTPVKGFIRSINAIQGDHLHKGDVIASIDHPEFARMQRDLLESNARLGFLEKEFERKKELLSGDAVSKREFEMAESELKSEQARFEGLKSELLLSGFSVDKIISSGVIQRNIAIVSPFNGFVSKLNVNIGKLVNPEDLIAEVINTDHLHLEIHVYAKDVAMVQEGQLIQFTLPGSDSIHRAKVYLVGKAINPENNTVMVHAHFEDESKYTAGTFINGQILTGSREVNSISLQGLIKEGENWFVFVKTDKGFVKSKAEIGYKDNTQAEIISIEGFTPDVELVTKGAYYLQGAAEE
ncbi:MAG: efflux RND transporter periplasmic adaptor subunit [Flavobacteriales bacterium]|nr:efflux RND transporter periplasmic adaptor subunit [Flavobacteriales bacterium]